MYICLKFISINEKRWLQPVYVSSALMTSYVALKLFTKKPVIEACPEPYNTLTLLVCTGANLGLQLWITFMAGQTMIRILPRHQFGAVQRQLFPKYMFLTSLFSFGGLSAFLNMKPVNLWQNDTLKLVIQRIGHFLNTYNHTSLLIRVSNLI